MNRVDGKVKDIVEVRPFEPLHDFSADPASTLKNYRFTDITSDLMTKWFQRLVTVAPGRGAACALAGFRGVGKSHFMAVFGALAASPELSSDVDDDLVRSTIESFVRNQFTVAFVKRGLGSSLLDELRGAISGRTGVAAEVLGESSDSILTAFQQNSASTPILLFDTVVGREARVSRDDGPLLSEIADGAKRIGIYVGVVLDDDISGADGVNASISGTYTIDYLDQEHLYKIVDLHIFAKREDAIARLKNIYGEYRNHFPGFKWSEQRFLSLYPLHPAILEIAPLVRLYVQDFALLGFASEAGVKILGRPANSLIGLDEVFDAVEKRLRNIAELSSTFEIFDLIDEQVISRSAVDVRLSAKLALKGLLLLSIDGRGTTASEIAAAMMITGHDGLDATAEVERHLEDFQAAFPEALIRSESIDGFSKYLFRSSSSVEALDAKEMDDDSVPESTLWELLIRHTAERFSDASLIIESGTVSSHSVLEWQGSLRRGEIVWLSTDGDAVDPANQILDWRVIVDHGGTPPEVADSDIIWRVGKLSQEDRATIRRLHILQTDEEVRSEFSEGLARSLQALGITIGRIWERIFIDEGSLEYQGKAIAIEKGPDSVHTLAQLFTISLENLFSEEYPSHPRFDGVLDAKAASELISGFFSGKSDEDSNSQDLAKRFAVPLGLARYDEQKIVPFSTAELHTAEFAQIVGKAIENGSDVVEIATVEELLRERPFGLSRESIRTILAAFVAQGHVEFVTAGGNRIGSRSLDLHMIWDDVVGISKPAHSAFSSDRLAQWAQALLGSNEKISLANSAGIQTVTDGLALWLADWRTDQLMERFRELPDECINVAAWQISERVGASFEAIAKNIASMTEENTDIRDILTKVANIFNDSIETYQNRAIDRDALKALLDGIRMKESGISRLAVLKPSDNNEIEDLRISLSEELSLSDAWVTEDQELLAKKVNDLTSHYLKWNSSVAEEANNPQSVRDVIDGIMSSDEWQEFDLISSMRWFDPAQERRIRRLVHGIRSPQMSSKDRDKTASQSSSTNDGASAKGLDPNLVREELFREIAVGITAFRYRLANEIDDIKLRGTDISERFRDPLEDLSFVREVPVNVLAGLRMAGDRYGPASFEAIDASEPFRLDRVVSPNLHAPDTGEVSL